MNKPKVLIINGPNLNLVGEREPDVYGSYPMITYINDLTKLYESELELVYFQSNSEGEIIDILQQSLGNIKGLIINGGALSHYSYAIADALSLYNEPKVEVHISNIYAREEFRRKSVFSSVVDGMISGLGLYGYNAAVEYILVKNA